MNGVLDYFGTTVNIAARIQKASQGGDVVVTDEVFDDIETQKLVSNLVGAHEHLEVEIRGLSGTRRVRRVRHLFFRVQGWNPCGNEVRMRAVMPDRCGYTHGPVRTDEECLLIEFSWYPDKSLGAD